MSFRKLITILKESSGTYVNGVWQAGARTSSLAMCSVQPVDMRKDMQALPEGRHLSDFVKIYSSERLQVTADGEGIQPDIVVKNGYAYEIISLSENQSDVINHYKYIAVKVFKFTTLEKWTDGSQGRA